MSKTQTGAPGAVALSRGQKAAQTRAINKRIRDEQDAKITAKPTTARDAKVKAVENRVWMQSQGATRKRAGSVMAPTNTNKNKKTKNDSASVDNYKTLADTPAAKGRLYKPAVIASDSDGSSVPSDVDDVDADDDAEGQREAEAEESDDEQLMQMAPRSLAEALQSEAPLFQGHHYDSGDEEYDPVLHAPPKMRRKSRSVSTSSYDSGHVSVPDDEASEDGVPSSTSRRSSVHSAGFPEDRSDLHDPVPGLAKTSSSSFKKAPHAVDLLETDDHVIKKAVGKSKQPTNPKGWDSSPALSAPSGFTAGGVPAFKLMSKREQAHRKEAPTWGGPPEAIEVLNRTPATHRNRRDSSVVSQGHGNNDNINFDATTGEGYDMTVLAYNTRGKLNLMSQTAEIQAVARSAIDKTYVSIITVNAYPDLGKRKQVVLDACVRAAEELGPRYQRILDLLQDDTQTEFRKAVGDIPDGRISTLRRDIKTIASGHCVGHYGLRQDCETYVTNLLDAQRYVFAGEHVADRVNYKLPWRQHAIAAVIRQVFFTGKNNFVNSHPCLFCTTIEGLDDQPEVPAGMVALVCTAIHACIAEWSTGKHVEEEFSGSEWAGTYRIHKMMLDHVREKEPLFFHETMHYIYKQADSSTRNGSSAESKQPNALALMDLSALA